MTQPRRAISTGAKLLLVFSLATLMPGSADAKPATVTQEFNTRALLGITTVAPYEGCTVGVGMRGFALDVRYGMFDGLWWNSICLGENGASGQWYINYINGQFASGLWGTWKGDQVATAEGGVTYTGTFAVSYGFGPWTGTTGSGKFTLLLAPAQQWVALDGQLVLPSKHTAT